MEQKTVFISYRRALSKHLARSIYMDLKANGWDAFLDVNTIDSGDFDRVILNQIGARAHFILLISPGSLERCANEGDWVLREIQEAVRLERNIVPIIEEGADFAREMTYLPPDVRATVSKKNALPLPHFFFEAAVEMLRSRFLKTPEYIRLTKAPSAEVAEVQRRMAAVEAEVPSVLKVPLRPATISQSPPANLPPLPTNRTSLALLPAPFAWIEIPGKGYSIAKYPVTKAQFARFIESNGYNTERWWTAEGWEHRQQNGWTEPRYWQDSLRDGADYPIGSVSWFEAVAFCLWLCDVTDEKIMLPTEDQWQYAAQGDDGRTFPWGRKWDTRRCNNHVDGRYDDNAQPIGETTTVRAYEGVGDSPFGVVGMAGNVWEWCLTDYENKTNDMNSRAEYRVLRGGSWNDYDVDSFRCDMRLAGPIQWSGGNWSFRLSRTE